MLNKNRIIHKYLSIIVGIAILTFGLYNVHSRCPLSEGGVLGLTLLIHHWFNISPSITSLIIDCCCFTMATMILGKGFLRDSLFCTLLFSLWYRVFETMGPVLPNLSEFPLVSAIVGGLFVGVGCGLVVRQKIAAGGDDALALVMNKCLKLSIAHCYNITDFIVLLLSLTYIPLGQIAYSLLSVYISSKIIQLFCNISNIEQQ